MTPIPSWTMVAIVAIVAVAVLLIVGRRTASMLVRGVRAPRWPLGMQAAERLAKGLGPYLLALAVFATTAHWTLNAVAAGYADKLFTLALVLIRASTPAPPAPPAS